MRSTPNPAIMRWAIERCGKTPSDFVGIFKRIDKWLAGDADVQPTTKQMGKLAAKTHVLLPYFYMDEIPDLGFQIPDFRTKGSKDLADPSPELYDVINIMQSRQDWLSEYLESEDAQRRSFVGSCQSETSIAACVEEMRKLLPLENEWARGLQSDAAVRKLRETMEKVGVYVFAGSHIENNTSRSFSVDEFRGFVLTDTYAPLIFINTKDAKSAQLFTLAHEFAHLLFGESGVDDASLSASSEAKCNAIAAEFLVPSALVYRIFEGRTAEEAIKELKKSTKASEAVCLIRAKNLKCISSDQYHRLRDEYESRLSEGDSPVARTSGDGPRFYVMQKNRMGKLFPETVYTALMSDRLLFSDAYKLTGLNAKSFGEYFRREGMYV